MERLGLHTQHETHEYLIASVTVNQRTESHFEGALLATYHHPLVYLGQCGKDGAAKLLAKVNLVGSHVDELGIFNRYGVDRIGKVLTERKRASIIGHDTVDGHFAGSKVDEALCLGIDDAAKQQECRDDMSEKASQDWFLTQ